MKSATAHDPPIARVSENPTGGGVYSTRIRKPKRRTPPAASSSRRTRAEKSRDTPSREGTPRDHSPPVESLPSQSLSPSKPKSRSTSRSPNKKNMQVKWDVHELGIIAHLVAQKNTVQTEKLVEGAQRLSKKRREDVVLAVDELKAPFDGKLPFAPDCGVETLLSSLAAQIDDMKAINAEREEAMAKYSKVRSEKQAIERINDKLIREARILAEEVDKQRKETVKVMQRRTETEAKYREEKERLAKSQADRDALRDTLQKQKLSELEMRRRLDRMRLKVAASRGHMVTASVERLGYEEEGWGETESLDDVSADPLGRIWEGLPAKALKGRKQEEKVEDVEMDENTDATQLRLWKNRLTMSEAEAEEWRRTLEAEQRKVSMLKVAKARLEDELARAKGSGGKVAGKLGKGSAKIGKGRPRVTPVVEAKKTLKRSRKGRPRRGLVPFP